MTDDQLIAVLRQRVKGRPPATERVIARAEKSLGFALPPLLRRLYAEVGDGGFGPSHGIHRLHPERGGEKGASLVGIYDTMRAAPADDWSQELLPICDWGC